MATVKNISNTINTFDTQTIADVADVTSKFDEGQFRYNYNDGAGVDIDFDSPAKAPETNDEIIISYDSDQFNYLMSAADYAKAGTAN